MANTPNRVIRVEDELWDAYGQAVEAKGMKRSDDLRAHMLRVVRAFKAKSGKVDPGNRADHTNT